MERNPEPQARFTTMMAHQCFSNNLFQFLRGAEFARSIRKVQIEVENMTVNLRDRRAFLSGFDITREQCFVGELFRIS